MTTATIAYRNQVLAELENLPDEYLPFVLQLVRAFRESLTLKPAAERDGAKPGKARRLRFQRCGMISMPNETESLPPVAVFYTTEFKRNI
jgi:hypothetical protein